MIANGKLDIFENFWVDENLKKKPENDAISELNTLDFDLVSTGSEADGRFIIPQTRNGISQSFLQSPRPIFIPGNERNEHVLLREYLEYVYSQNRTIINWLKLKLTSLLSTERKNRPLKNKIRYESIDLFFQNIHNAVNTLNINPENIKFYTDALSKAVENGQEAFAEILAEKRNGIIRELKLLELGIKEYVEEEDVVKFYNKSNPPKKVLKLTWMRNYSRIIPDEVLEKKKKFDEKEAFDNYVILHFDKSGDASEMTKKEKEKAKDPILFGVVAGSRKLFYVGDWIDEYCDLTLDKFLKEISQKKVKELSQKSIENDIKK